jgi:peptidyl-prolyl cis-trans isomerase SurA
VTAPAELGRRPFRSAGRSNRLDVIRDGAVRIRRAFRTALSLAALVGLADAAHAIVAERVVAVVGDQAILLSDLRQRAKPLLLQVQQRATPGAQRAAAESEIFKQVLERMVDERLESQQAERAHITVSTDEIEAGMRNVAGREGMTVEQLIREATQIGTSPQEYRDEVKRQILQVKLLQLRVKNRIRITDDDVAATYARLVRLDRRRLGYRIAWVVLRVPEGSSPAARSDRRDLAERIAATGRAGADALGRTVDFSTLARSFSDDTASRDSGGDLGWHKPGELAQAIEDELIRLDVGQISSPFAYKDAIVVMKVLERESSQLPPLAQAREEVTQRTYNEQMEKIRKQWMLELRRGVHVDSRL